MAHNIQTEYEMFRQVRRENPLEEDNLSAQYSANESYPDFEDRAQTNSARSMPGGDKIDQLQHQLLINLRQNQELNQKNSFLEQEHRLLQGKYQLME